MFENLLKSVFGSKHDRELRRVRPIVEEINRLDAEWNSLTDEQLQAKTGEFRARLAGGGESLDDLLPEAYAAVKQACRRLCGQSWDVCGIPVTWDMIPYDVQLIGGVMLHEGKIAEMATGEGKTLVATLPIYLNGLGGRGVHLVTVNDYLARRDSQWMGRIYEFLGLTVGCIQNQMDPPTRREQYGCDITYGTNNEFGFDYLRDNMAVRPEHKVQRGFAYAIVDEVDSVLIDEARTPLIISGPVEAGDQGYDQLKPYVERVVRAQQQWVNEAMSEADRLLKEPDKEWEAGIKLLQISRAAPKNKRFVKLMSDQPALKRLTTRVELEYLRDKRMHELDDELFFTIDEKSRNVDLLEKGRTVMTPSDPEQFVVPDLTAQLSEIEGDQSLSPDQRVARRDEIYRAYGEKNEQIHSVHALLKAYSLYERDVDYVVQDGKVMIVDEFTGRLMPGRRWSDGIHQAVEAKENVQVEGETQTLATITLQNFFRMYDKLAGMTGTAETEAAEFWEIYKLDVAVIPTNKPIRRADENDVVYRTKREKYKAIIDEIAGCNERQQPVLVGTITVEVSELLSRMLKIRGVKHNVLNAKFHQQEAEIVAGAGRPGAVTIATNMAGRGTDIKLGPGVPGLGGLHIVGTERHESRRIDRQLRGRAGRQGDPGSSRFFLSLEDDLMRLFGAERISGLMAKMGVEEGEVIEHGLVTRSIGTAQKRVEAHNFDIRKHLLEYDNVMNKQREEVYRQRNEALMSEDISARVLEDIQDVVADRVERFTEGGKAHRDEWNLKGLADELSYLLMTPVAATELEAGRLEDLADKAMAIAERAYRGRETEFTPTVARELERHLYLYTVDEHWREHLHELDHLKGGIGLRAYGQRDPLVEYKKEAFTAFERMMTESREEFVSRFFRVQLQPAAAREVIAEAPRPPRQMVEQHPEAQTFGGGGAPAASGGAPRAGEAPSAAPQAHEPVRSAHRPGRNDPCWCGSGKKYKKCHMPSDEGVETRV